MKVSGSVILSLSLKTIGKDIHKSEIYSIGASLYDLKQDVSLATYDTLIKTNNNLLKEEIKNNIKKFGKDQSTVIVEVLDLINKADFILIQHGKNHTKKTLTNFFEKNGFQLPLKKFWIDIHNDVIHKSNIESSKLSYICAAHNYLLPQKRNCYQETLGMIHILKQYIKSDWKEILTRSIAKDYIIQALVDYDTRKLAEKADFSWKSPLNEFDLESFPELTEAKAWIREVKSYELKSMLSDKNKKFEIAVLRSGDLYCYTQSFCLNPKIYSKYLNFKNIFTIKDRAA